MGLGIVCSVKEADAREFKEAYKQEFTLSGDAGKKYTFHLNISGFIKVEGYSGNKSNT